jgi:tRNA-i(6)A37 thiotransferase enzyme miaB
MNLHESEKLAGILCERGYSLCDSEEDADLIVFNTCCIRENAEKKAEGNIGALKQLKKRKKDIIIAVGGCMTQQPGAAEKLKAEFPYLDIVFGTHNLEKFGEMLDAELSTKKKTVNVWEKEGEVIEGTPKTRTSYPNAWVNITYGCNNFCTYCIVPYVRGRERSRTPEEIINECKDLVSAGYKEITLLGQNVNSYGHDLGNTNFSALLREIDKIEGNFRLRFMTNHPKDFSEELIKTLSECKKTTKNVHLPVQSGSDRVLKLMNRRYTAEDYIKKVELLRKYIPDIAVTTDIMVGFPTETEEDFNDTYDLMKKIGFAGAFTFVYSPRSGTPAAKMDGQIDEETSKRRIMKLIDLQNKENRRQSKEYLGKTVEILCEGYDDKKKKYLGRDTRGRMAYFDGDETLHGNFVNVKITGTGGMSLIGEVVSDLK